MYIEKRRLENGRYEYLVKCTSCPDIRWTSDIRAPRCRACSVKGRTLGYCVVHSRNCKKCNCAMMLRFKPKEDRPPTCKKCKAKKRKEIIMARKEKEEKAKAKIKEKVKCSECKKLFESRNSTVKACSKICSITRKNRVKREKSTSLMSPQKKKRRREEAKEKIAPKPKAKVVRKKRELGGVDKEENPVYIRSRENNKFQFRVHYDGPTESEISTDLIKKFYKNGGEASVKFKAAECNKETGQTECSRIAI